VVSGVPLVGHLAESITLRIRVIEVDTTLTRAVTARTSHANQSRLDA
jgi:hypothetical protein